MLHYENSPLWSRHPTQRRGRHFNVPRQKMFGDPIIEPQKHSVAEPQKYSFVEPQASPKPAPQAPPKPAPQAPPKPAPQPEFQKLRVSEVFCPVCRSAQPVYEVLGQTSPEMTQYDVVCKTCSSVVGQRTITEVKEPDSCDLTEG